MNFLLRVSKHGFLLSFNTYFKLYKYPIMPSSYKQIQHTTQNPSKYCIAHNSRSIALKMRHPDSTSSVYRYETLRTSQKSPRRTTPRPREKISKFLSPHLYSQNGAQELPVCPLDVGWKEWVYYPFTVFARPESKVHTRAHLVYEFTTTIYGLWTDAIVSTESFALQGVICLRGWRSGLEKWVELRRWMMYRKKKRKKMD